MAYRFTVSIPNCSRSNLGSFVKNLVDIIESIKLQVNILSDNNYILSDFMIEIPEVPHSNPLLYHPHFHFLVYSDSDIKYFISFLNSFSFEKRFLFDVQVFNDPFSQLLSEFYTDVDVKDVDKDDWNS